jgi:cAMP phosphodiesterase
MEKFDVKSLITETSFPNRLEGLARASGHMTPAMLDEEIRKMSRPPEAILVMHIKPQFAREIRAEIRALGRKGLRILESGDQFSL